jgi:uncharacterized membrane protein YedE/YeeE
LTIDAGAAGHERPQLQVSWLGLAIVLTLLLVAATFQIGWRDSLLVLVGLAMGVALYKASFGFTAAYRKFFVDRDASGLVTQSIMLIATMVLFAPFLAAGEAFERPIGGAVAPVSVSMAFGAFLFGIGMQAGAGCASGTLFSVGGGRIYAAVTLLFFCLGGFWGSLDLYWWVTLPSMGAISIGEQIGFLNAVALQILALAVLFICLRFLGYSSGPAWSMDAALGFLSWRGFVFGQWPLVFSGLLLALLNWLTLIIAGHPWSITWGFALWTAKVFTSFGWDPSSSLFWSGGFQQQALSQSLLHDTTSVMNFAIIVGALMAAAVVGRVHWRTPLEGRRLALAIGGGLAMGYGARLAYGCNIGAFFSGIASTSLHGWVWIACALPGNWLGIRFTSWLKP